jgi:hypothetical protein
MHSYGGGNSVMPILHIFASYGNNLCSFLLPKTLYGGRGYVTTIFLIQESTTPLKYTHS